MHTREYSKHLGLLSPDQFQAALNRFGLGNFLHAEPIPFGLFGQNVFLTSIVGEFVLRGRPHFPWQFPIYCLHLQHPNLIALRLRKPERIMNPSYNP